MTNRELLRAPPEALSPLDRQRRHVLAVESVPVPCPACKAPVDAVSAAGLDLDAYVFALSTPAYRCPHCGAALDRVTPLIALGPGWNWQLNHDWLADTGGEKPETYAYLPVVQQYLKGVKFPPVVTVRYEPKSAPYRTLEGQCLHTGTLPSLAYGGKSCSVKWKRQPQDTYILARFPPHEHVARGRRVVRAIGFDASEGRRTYAGVVKAVGLDAGEGHRLTWARPKPGSVDRKPSREAWLDAAYFAYWYALMDWGMDRAACERSIRAAGLPVPVKSACWFCPASKKPEILWLREHHPRLLRRALAIEANARPNLTSVRGLGRSFAWGEFLDAVDRPPLFPDCP